MATFVSFVVLPQDAAEGTATVSIIPCVRSAPSISLFTSPVLSVPSFDSNQVLRVGATLTNNDNIGCPASSFSVRLVPKSQIVDPPAPGYTNLDFGCNVIKVIIVPDLAPLEISYTLNAMTNGVAEVLYTGDYRGVDFAYCKPSGQGGGGGG
jgi:hypothetical protein